MSGIISIMMTLLKLYLTDRKNKEAIEKRKAELNDRWNRHKGKWAASAKAQWDKLKNMKTPKI